MSEAIIFENMPYNLFLKQRMEFVVICGDHLAANVMRVIESEMIKLKEAWQAKVEKAIEEKKTPPKEPKAYWVRLSLSQIIARLYMYDSGKLKKPESEDLNSPEWVEYRMKKALSISKGTLRKAIDLLESLGFLLERSKPGDEFGAPIWTLHKENVQKALKTLPTNPFTIFHALGGGSKFEYGGGVQNLNVPPTNFECGDTQNLNVPGSENESGEVQNLEVDIDSSIDTSPDTEIDNEEEGTLPAHDHDADTGATAPIAPSSHDSSHENTEGHDETKHSHRDSAPAEHRHADSAVQERSAGNHQAVRSEHAVEHSGRQVQQAPATHQVATSERVAPAESAGYTQDEDTVKRPAVQLSTGAATSPQQSAKVEPKVLDVRTLTLKAHAAYIFQWLDIVKREAKRDQRACYARTKTDEGRVVDLITSCWNSAKELTEENVRKAWLKMWNEPTWKNGFSWKKAGISIKAFCEHYSDYLEKAWDSEQKSENKGNSTSSLPSLAGMTDEQYRAYLQGAPL